MYNSSGINRVFLVGVITNNAKWTLTEEGEEVLHFLLTTKEIFKKNGQNVEHIEKHKILIPEKVAQIDLTAFTKGTILSVEGKIQTYQSVDDNNLKRYYVEILVNKFQSLNQLAALYPYQST
jgi:single stranded DNA-binding protein